MPSCVYEVRLNLMLASIFARLGYITQNEHHIQTWVFYEVRLSSFTARRPSLRGNEVHPQEEIDKPTLSALQSDMIVIATQASI